MRKDAQLASAKLHDAKYASVHMIIIMNTREKTIAFLEHIKAKTGKSYSRIASDAGVSPSTINRYLEPECAQADLYGATKDKIAKVAGYESYDEYVVTLNKIQTLKINPKKQLPIDKKSAMLPLPSQAPVTGYIGANLAVTPVDSYQREVGFEMVSIPINIGIEIDSSTRALVVDGETESDLFEDGYKVLYRVNDGKSIPDECLNNLCVVQVKDGELLIRKLYSSRQPGKYHLRHRGRPEISNCEIEWAAKVLAVVT